MQILYYDKTIEKLESQEKYKELFQYLETLPFSDSVFATQIAYAWYLYLEGQFVTEEVSNDWAYYLDKFIEKIKYAVENLKSYPIVCLMVGYTLHISGMIIAEYVNFNYEIESKKFYQLCLANSKDDKLTALCEYLVSYNKIKPPKSYVNLLFPNNSLMDSYFKDVL